MKTLFVHECFGAFGGAEGNLFHTAKALKERGHEVGLIHGRGTGKGEAEWQGLFTQRFPLGDAPAQVRIAQACSEFKPNLFYIHKMADPLVLQAILQTELPVARMVHDHDLYCMRSYKYNYFTRKICTRPASGHCVFPCGSVIARNREGGFPLKWVSYRAKKKEIFLNQQFDRLIVASQFMKEELVRNGFNAEHVEIHPPVPPNLFQDQQSSFSSRNRIIYSGQIIRGKGVDVLLQALALVKTPFECIILGDGNHRAECEKLSVRLGLSERVFFKGFVPADQLKNYYQDGSVMVMSSVWPEPFGATGLEAMHFGLPVVGFDAGGIREWLVSGYNGFMVPWMDTQAFARRVDELLRDKALAREMGARGQRLVRTKFNFDTYISGLEKLFTQLSTRAEANVLA